MGRMRGYTGIILLLQVLTISCYHPPHSPPIRPNQENIDRVNYYREKWLETEEELMQCLELGEELRRNTIESTP